MAARRAWSLGTRLTLLYGAVLLIALALFATLAYWQISTRLAQNHLRFLQAKFAEEQTDLREANGDPRMLAKEIFEETAESRPRQYLARLSTANGDVLAQTPGMDRKLPTALFPAPVAGTLASEDVREQVITDPDDHGRDVFALASMRMTAAGSAQPLIVQLALGVTGDDKMLERFRQALWLSFLVLGLLPVAAGRWIAALGLRPLEHIARTAQAVTPAHLSARIPVTTAWPTELHEVVTVFNAMLTRLEEAFNRLSRFSSDLAHELRTPLNSMMGELEVCLLRERSEAEYRRALLSNLDECRRLSVLTENLLFFARAESTELALRPESFAGGDLCGWIVAQLEPVARARAVRVVQAGDALIYADPSLFRQAVTNLLLNALRHSSAGSTVSLILCRRRDGAATVTVQDHGEGIEPKHIPYIFDRFYQANIARSREEGQGTGLGLSIVKMVMNLHGGSVEVASVPGEVTTFTLVFPG